MGLYFCWRSWTSCLDTWHHVFYQMPTDKKSISDWLRKGVRWTEAKHQHGAGNLKGLEWFWMKEWSLISCQVFSNLIRHYRRKLLYYFCKWRFQKLLHKRVPLIVQCVQLSNVSNVSNVYYRKTFHNAIPPHFKFVFSNKRFDLCVCGGVFIIYQKY